MLRYNVRLNDGSIKEEELRWDEKYLSRDLSYVTGITDPSYHLEKVNVLPAANSIINTDGRLDVDAWNVYRQGFVIARGKEYPIYSGNTVDYSVVPSGETIDYHYIDINGKYFYFKELEDNISGFTIDNLLNYDENREEPNVNDLKKYIHQDVSVSAESSSSAITIDTVYWIEDNTVEIDGYEYFYDRNENGKDEGEGIGILKYRENGMALEASSITKCDKIECRPYQDSDDFEEVTKFVCTKRARSKREFEDVTFCKYYYYVKYKDHYCNVRQKYSGDTFEFVCDIPKYLFSEIIDEEPYDLETEEFPLYYVLEYGEEGASYHYRESVESGWTLDSEHQEEHHILNMNDLKTLNTFIYIEKYEDAYFKVEYDVMNANSGNEIIIYLNDTHSAINEDDKVYFTNGVEDSYIATIYNSSDYGGADEDFVLYSGRKYLIEKNIQDKVVIEGQEYDIEYIDGKENGKDCLVLIEGEKVPMKISGSTNGGTYSGGTVYRYGNIIIPSASTNVLSAVSYDIKPYDGIIVNGEKQLVQEIEETSEDGVQISKYCYMNLPREHCFIVNSIIGSSMYICAPYVDNSSFTESFNRYITNEICRDVVDSKDDYSLMINNKIFGEYPISSEMPFIRNLQPTSSDDYYNLFDDLVIYTRNAYINIPIKLDMDVANNIMLGDIIKTNFYEVEKDKAINPIVDMEKDVYTPKYIYGYYNNGEIERGKEYKGSRTVFKPIKDINLNFHFRTRDLDSWKVNNSYNSIAYSSTTASSGDTLDNWFITDFHPYCDILRISGETCGTTLESSSDLMGLLYFTNDDIFYQRSKVEKTFVRLSFYDSTDPQTQSLLATSCVFIDEHSLFKKYIDNSRKYENDYGSVQEPIYGDSGTTDITPIYKSPRVSVRTEYLGSRRDNKSYSAYSADCTNIDMFNDNHRISSRMKIMNKYETDTSSEGYYLYIFREYAEKLHPKPIYMKVEFNHAGIGQQIPFVIPMHWERIDGSENKYEPISALTLSNSGDVKTLKEGFPLSFVYAQTYIPLYAVYDFDNNEYAYIFDDRYVKEDENGDISLNLYEMKIKDEANDESEEHLQDKGILNINTNQFELMSFNNVVE